MNSFSKSTQKQNLVCLITGGGSGIGLDAARQLGILGHTVIIGVRTAEKAKRALSELADAKVKATSVELDVTDEESIQKAVAQISQKHGRVDVLVNNAGVFLDGPRTALALPMDIVHETLETNTLGPLKMIQAIAPLMVAQKTGRIVNVSSGMGQLSEMEGGSLAYRLSKTSLNALTRIFHNELHKSGVLVNSMCPGWVKTAMGGQEAERTPEQGADTVTYLATLPPDGPSGRFFRDRTEIAW
jgi:NAD(P)-dependent dehydrogenase (short-subunit alcohol dehydrogenase family)